jgi:hypothetical protein
LGKGYLKIFQAAFLKPLMLE